jgi:thioredoxin reductase (NADPH)
MITTDELRAIPLFAALDDKELAYLARTAADIQLSPGEYAVHESETRAFFAVVEGKLEVTKIIDGVETVIGVRGPGELFGEVPMVLNTPFLASMRAVEPSRLLRIEPSTYHTLCATAPEISAKVGAAALDRIEGLHDIAAQPPAPELLVVGPNWDPPTGEIRDFLHRNQVPFDWVTPDDPILTDLSIDSEATHWPLVRLQDGSIVVGPTKVELANAVGLATAPADREYDVVIIGGGPGGLAAAVYGASEGLHTLLLEREAPGGQAGTSSRIENYLGFPVGVSGDELAHRALTQARRLGAEIVVTRAVRSISPDTFDVSLDDDEVLHARAVVLALGVTWRRLELDSIDRFIGRGVFYGASRDEARSTQGQDIYLVGGGNSAGQAALYFANYAKTVTIVVRGASLSDSMSFYLVEQLKRRPNIRCEVRSEIVAVYGTEHLEAIDVADRAANVVTRRETPALFVFIGADTDTGWLPEEIALDRRGFVMTGADARASGRWSSDRDPYLLETTVPGIFAVGDVRSGSVKRVAAGVGEGSMAIAFVHQYLQIAVLPGAGAHPEGVGTATKS